MKTTHPTHSSCSSRCSSVALAALGSWRGRRSTRRSVEQLNRLREGLADAYAARATSDAMLQYLHPQVVITFPDGRVLEGPAALRDYIDEMLHGPDPAVRRASPARRPSTAEACTATRSSRTARCTTATS